MSAVVATLTQWFAPWQALYSDSKLVDTAVTSVHLVAILIGGGLAVSADRATLRAARGESVARRRMLEDLHATHRPVLIALAVLFVSGVALATADVPTFAKSPVFLVKLVLVALLCSNGLFLYRTEEALRRHATDARWRRLRLASWLSLALWIGTVVVGATLVNAA